MNKTEIIQINYFPYENLQTHVIAQIFIKWLFLHIFQQNTN